MYNFTRHATFFDQPILLDKQQQEAPMEAVRYFFGSYTLSEVRRNLHQLVQVALTSENPEFEEAEPRDYILYFCGQLEAMIEAAMLVAGDNGAMAQ